MLGILLLFIILIIIKIKLIIEYDQEFKIMLVIGNIYKIKLNKQNNNQNTGIKEVLEVLKKITNPFLIKFLNQSTGCISFIVGNNLFDSPYLIFSSYMGLILIKNELSKLVGKIKKENYQVIINEKSLKMELIFSISLLKLAIIILTNYQNFKLLIKGES
ncbi:MAG: hypothetical protein IJX78_00160 [Bacilli bacterium]|nr:hypothetical protein [Bacilli bacterium]